MGSPVSLETLEIQTVPAQFSRFPSCLRRTPSRLGEGAVGGELLRIGGRGRMREEEVEKLRGVVRDCVSKHLYSSAIFFADKVAALTGDPADIYMQAQALYLGRHYRRALHLLNSSQIVFRDLRFRYLAAKCLVLDASNRLLLPFVFLFVLGFVSNVTLYRTLLATTRSNLQ